jgi:hypothetical protein
MGYSSNLTKQNSCIQPCTYRSVQATLRGTLQQCREGIVILKTLLGTDAYCSKYLEDVLNKHETAVD